MRTDPLPPQAPVARAPRRWPAILVFMLLAGLVPETIATNSTSVIKIIHNPLALVFVALFYGTADLVIREAIIRRPLGLAGKVLLGVAFGFVNEGVVAGTWYSVRPAGYAFVNGIDWSWAISLTVFHLFISVLLPVYLFDSVFPTLVGVPLLRRRGIILTTLLFLAFSALTVLTPLYHGQRFAALLAAVALAVIAVRLPPAPRQAFTPAPALPAPGLWRLRALGFAAMLAYFLCIYLLPALFASANQRVGAPPAVPGLLANIILLALAGWALALGLNWSRRPGWAPRRQLALISGALGFSVLISFIPALLATWQPLATVPFGVFFAVLAWRARVAARRDAAIQPSVYSGVSLPS